MALYACFFQLEEQPGSSEQLEYLEKKSQGIYWGESGGSRAGSIVKPFEVITVT